MPTVQMLQDLIYQNAINLDSEKMHDDTDDYTASDQIYIALKNVAEKLAREGLSKAMDFLLGTFVGTGFASSMYDSIIHVYVKQDNFELALQYQQKYNKSLYESRDFFFHALVQEKKWEYLESYFEYKLKGIKNFKDMTSELSEILYCCVKSNYVNGIPILLKAYKNNSIILDWAFNMAFTCANAKVMKFILDTYPDFINNYSSSYIPYNDAAMFRCLLEVESLALQKHLRELVTPTNFLFPQEVNQWLDKIDHKIALMQRHNLNIDQVLALHNPSISRLTLFSKSMMTKNNSLFSSIYHTVAEPYLSAENQQGLVQGFSLKR